MSASPSYRIITAAVILVLYCLLCAFLLAMLKSLDDPQWSRAMAIFSAFGALATTSAGILFGVESQATTIADARTQAEAATTRAAEAGARERALFAALGDHASGAARSAEEKVAAATAVLGQPN